MLLSETLVTVDGYQSCVSAQYPSTRSPWVHTDRRGAGVSVLLVVGDFARFWRVRLAIGLGLFPMLSGQLCAGFERPGGSRRNLVRGCSVSGVSCSPVELSILETTGRHLLKEAR